MSNRTASTLSVILSLLLLFIFAILMVIFEMIALNGVSESKGLAALGISLTCLGAGAILIGVLAWKTTALLIAKFNLNPILAVLLSVTLGLLVSGAITFLAVLVSIPLAGIQ